ncbi:MAG TPA: 5-formyltetrahydrofolate cyclo-ligase [Bacillus sp. (in: firmicutes)]|nr:5-formyltetrahydrofolate cyclo-ligase [Bacillus sp. (in: firmicutes)]
MDIKSVSRKKIKERLQSLSVEQYKTWSECIANMLYTTAWWREANVIALTVSRGREVSTIPIIERAWASGKKVVIPKCNSQDYTMEFYCITSFSQLETVYFGLKEPIVEQTIHYKPEEIDLMIVPGVVFSGSGYRIGYGGGYYDRYLAHFQGAKISLAFTVQLQKEIPVESHDIPVEAVITNEGIMVCNG